MRHALALVSIAAMAACGTSPADLAEVEKRLPRRVMDPPTETPDWSQSKYVRWASAKVSDERAFLVDIPGGSLDSMLDDERVSTRLNADYRAIFFHPRARPALTGRLGWPSVTLFDEQGCVRATGQPATVEELVALLDEGLKARADDVEMPLPAWRDDVPEVPPGGGTWTQDEPQKAAVFANPERGLPAVVYKDRPYIYGNREDAELVRADRPAAEAFLEALPANHAYLAKEGPVLACPLPIPPRPAPVTTEGDEAEEAEAPADG